MDPSRALVPRDARQSHSPAADAASTAAVLPRAAAEPGDTPYAIPAPAQPFVTDAGLRAAAIAEVALALAGPLDLRGVFERGVRTVVAALGASGAIAHLADEAGRELELISAVGATEQTLRLFQRVPFDGPTQLASVARERIEVLIHPGVMSSLPPPAQETVQREGIVSAFYLPLVAQDELVGTLALTFSDERARCEEIQQTARTVAALLAVAARNARLERDAMASALKLDVAAELSRLVGSEPELSRSFAGIARQVRRLVPQADWVSITLHEEERLYRIAAEGQQGDGLQPGEYLPVGSSASSTVIETRQPGIAHDLALERPTPLDERLFAAGFRSYVALPLLADDAAIGTLNVASRAPRAFDATNLAMLAGLAEQVSLVVRATRVFEQQRARRHEAELLERTGRLVAASLDLDQTLEAIADAAFDLTQADGSSILLARPGGRELEFRAVRGPSSAALLGHIIPADNGISGAAFQMGRPVRGDDLRTDLQGGHAPAATIVPTPRTLLAVPLLGSAGPLGVISVVRSRPEPFGAREERLLSTLAAQAVLAVEHARLYAEARRREHEAALLAEAGARLQATSDPAQALPDICALVGVTLNTCVACFLGSGPELRLVALHLAAGGALEQLTQALGSAPGQIDRGAARHLVDSGSPALLLSAGLTPAGSAQEPPVESCLGAPIHGASRLLGVLYLWTPPGGPRLDESHVQTLGLLADRLAAAFDNAALVHAAAQVQALQELDRLKSELLDTVSHELRTPLSLIYGFSELMSDPVFSQRYSRDEMVEMARHVHSGAQTMSRLVDDLLEYARLEQGRLVLDRRPVQVRALLERELRAFQGQPGGERLQLVAGDEALVVEADEARLRQIIGNLLSNALKYTSAGPIELVARLRQGVVEISVTDHGPGIPDADKPRVWEKFYRGAAKNLGIRGSGIGLSVVRALVEGHGGQVVLEDTPGGGATFRIELPAWRSASTSHGGDRTPVRSGRPRRSPR